MRYDEKSLYQKLMRFGKVSGCHQMAERSFFIKGRQFPVCARCTGVMIGDIMAYALFFLLVPPLEFCVMGCALMFADWYIQYVGLLESTNIRRMLTGIIGGYSLATLYCAIIKYVAKFLIKLWLGGI